jgi:hypothetical protein
MKEDIWDFHHIGAARAAARPTDTNTHGHILHYEDR